MKEKPLIVRVAESVSGYADTSKELVDALREAHERVKSLSDELRSKKSECRELTDRIAEADDKIKGLETSLREKDLEIDTLSKKLHAATERLEKALERSDALSQDLERVSDKQNELVGYIMSAIQNSEIFSGTSFSKEQVIQFLNIQFEQLLSVLDIDVYEDIDIPVNPLLHKIVATQYTEDIAKEGIISKSLGKGFRMGEKCIQEQPVEILTHNL